MKKIAFLMIAVVMLFLSCQQGPIAEEDESIVLSIKKGEQNVVISSIELPPEGGQIEVYLSCRGSWEVNAMTSSHFSVNPMHGNNSATLTIKMSANTDKDSRVEPVQIICGDKSASFAVRQNGLLLDFPSDVVGFKSKSETKSLSLSTNVSWEITAMVAWLKMTPTIGKGDQETKISVADNPSTEFRKGTITISLLNLIGDSYARKIAVIQDGSPSGTENGYDWVDLGLPSGTLWAGMNIGATSSVEYGDFFAWGETETKSIFNGNNYKHHNNESAITKYSGYLTGDNKSYLDKEDDAANANWGAKWYIPSRTEWEELKEYCDWVWVDINGSKGGYNVTSKSNGNSIFLPAAGFKSGAFCLAFGTDGHYWSSTLNNSTPSCAWEMSFSKLSSGNRFQGNSIRPVCHLD